MLPKTFDIFSSSSDEETPPSIQDDRTPMNIELGNRVSLPNSAY